MPMQPNDAAATKIRRDYETRVWFATARITEAAAVFCFDLLYHGYLPDFNDVPGNIDAIEAAAADFYEIDEGDVELGDPERAAYGIWERLGKPLADDAARTRIATVEDRIAMDAEEWESWFPPIQPYFEERRILSPKRESETIDGPASTTRG